MGIERLRVQGYRSLKDVTWEPGNLNVLIGQNGSGKSNLMRAIALLRDAATGDLSDSILREGGMGAVLWDSSAKELRWNVRVRSVPTGRDPDVETLDYDLVAARLGVGSAFRIELERLMSEERNRSVGSDLPFFYIQRDALEASVSDIENRVITAPTGVLPAYQTLLSRESGPFANPVSRQFNERLMSWGVFASFRVDPDALVRQPPVTRLDPQIAADGQNLVQVLHTLCTTEPNFRELVDGAMEAAFGSEYRGIDFAPASDQRIEMRVTWRSLRTQQSLNDQSDGTIRYLYLVTILGNPNPSDLIAIDEPETGLHPRMMSIVAELAAEAAEHTQVILATHSTEFLNAFEDPPTTTIARLVDGATELATASGDKLRDWLKGYGLGAAFETGEIEVLI